MRRALITLSLVTAAATVHGCTHVAEERARLDLEVGRAEAEGVKVTIEDGRGAVRHVDGKQIVVWASQPSLAITIESPDDRAIELVVRNVMPNVRARDGLELQRPERPTRVRALVPLTARMPRRVEIAPDDDSSREPFRVVMFADVQEAIGSVGDVYARMNADPKIRFVVFNGDQTQQGTQDQLERFERALDGLAVPFMMTLGNHELGTSESMYRRIFGRGSHHFTYRGVHFTLLDSASATLDPMVYGWLDGWLAEGREAAHLVSMHIPPFDPVGTRNGAFASRAEAAKLIERLRAAKVDGTYYGHVHSYYAYSNGNIPAFISGGGGAIPEKMDGIGRNYLTVDIDPVSQTIQTTLVRVD